MSLTVMAYALKLDDIKPLLGSKRADLKPPANAHEDVAEAYTELVEGSTSLRDPQHYVDAFELMCREHGRGLPNSGLATIGTSHFAKVDKALQQYQLGFDLSSVVYSGAPLGHPVLDHATSFGVVAAAQLQAAAQVLGGNEMTSVDPDVDEALCTIESWLAITTSSDLDIVGFFY